MVKMSSKLLFGKDSMDIREGINFARMRDERSAKAKKVLKQRGIPAILVTGEPNVRYLTVSLFLNSNLFCRIPYFSLNMTQ